MPSFVKMKIFLFSEEATQNKYTNFFVKNNANIFSGANNSSCSNFLKVIFK